MRLKKKAQIVEADKLTGGEVPSKTQKPKLWFWTIPSFLFFWVLGLGFLWWILIPPALWVWLVTKKKKLHYSNSCVALFLLGVWLIFAFLRGWFAGTLDPQGAPGAIYSALVWISASMLLFVFQNESHATRRQVVTGLVFFVGLQGLVSLVAVAFHPSWLSQVSLPFSGLLSQISSISPWINANLAYPGYHGGNVIRSAGFMGTAAWAGGFATLAILFCLIYRMRGMVLYPKRFWFVILLIVASGSLYLSYSRFSTLLLVVAAGCLIMYGCLKVLVNEVAGLFTFLTSFIAICILYVFAPWREFLVEQDSLRPGSSQTRLSSYSSALNNVSEQGLSTLLGGLGDKPQVIEGSFGVGSESTVFSLLVRGGIIGLLIFVAFILFRIQESAKVGDYGGILVMLTLLAHSLTADLDIGTLTLAIALFINVGFWSEESLDKQSVVHSDMDLADIRSLGREKP